MKLKNLMYATMIACAFASCSKDDEAINGGDAAATAKLDLKINVPTTKSIGTGTDDKAYTTLNVYVFDQTGKIEGKSLNTAAGKAGIGTSRLTENLSAGVKKVIVFANYALTATTYDAMLNETKAISGEENGALSMNSQVYTVTLQAGKTNYLGYTTTDASDGNYLDKANGNPVYLYRNVAKVVLQSVTFNPDASKYSNAKLKIENVYLLHGKTNSLVATEAAWGATATTTQAYSNGAADTVYEAWVTKLGTATAFAGKEALASSATKAEYANYIEAKTTEATSSTTAISGLGASFYAFENTTGDNNTLLVVAAKMSYGDLTMEKAETRYYTVAVGVDGMTTGDNYTAENTYALNGLTRTATGKVVRNIEYDITLGITGPGYDTPFSKADTKLDVKVEVVPFGTVNQGTVIE